jgi:ribosomal protein S27E
MSDDYMDGNMLGGELGELFAMDVTTAAITCVSCGASWMVAQTRVYSHAPGMVARCPACDAVLLRLVRGPGRAWLDLGGVTCLQLAVPGQ